MRYSRMPLIEIIPFFLSQGKEGEFWDFKQGWHADIEDLLKDIICFSNTAHDENCYLIFGVADDLSVTGVKDPRRKQADILDAISKLAFAGDNLPQISVDTIVYEEKELDVLTIYNSDKTPVYLKKPYGKMRQGCIYARVGDRNTPDNENAEIETIENLWRKRLGLTKAPLEYIFDSLRNKLEWVESESGYYHIYKPEYAIERVGEDDFYVGRGYDEFYSYAQTDVTTSYCMLGVKANGTILEKYQIVKLDSGRLSIPMPERGYVHLDNHVVSYIYYVKNSRTEVLMRFMYDPHNGEQRRAFSNLEKITLFFMSVEERKCFEDYINFNQAKIKKRIEASDEYEDIVTENETKTAGYKRSLRAAVVLKEMLEEFRVHNADYER